MDDRGGQGEGYSFSFDSTPGEDPRSFCPHCSLAVFVADVGLDLNELKLLGFNQPRFQNIQGIITALDQLLQMDTSELEQLAQQIVDQAEGEGESLELEAVVEQLQGLITKITEQKGRIETLLNIQNLAFDFDSLSFRDLVRGMGFKMDSAFRADFNDPNDPKKSSGLRVYDLDEFLHAMAEQVPGGVVESIRTLLGQVPNLPGAFEISGDDDDPLKPFQFHGIHSNLTIKQRSYTLTGNDVALLVYTLVNDTQRILPLVQVAFIADFDIPPQAKDLKTAFDPLSKSIMVYDLHPYAEPEKHY